MVRSVNVFFYVFALFLLVSFVSANQVVTTIEEGTKVVFRVLDVDDEEEILEVPLVSNYDGISVAEIKGNYEEFDLKIFLLDKETSEMIEFWIEGPFSSEEDIVLEIQNGELVVVEDSVELSTTTSENTALESTAEEITEPTEEVLESQETTEETTVSESTSTEEVAKASSVSMTGNVVQENSSFPTKRIIYSVLVIMVLSFLGFMFYQNRKNKVFHGVIPEERELLSLEKEIKEKRELIQMLREERKLKSKIESQRRRAAMTVAREDAIIDKLSQH